MELIKGNKTKELLTSISNHLSGRQDCKDIEFVVNIFPSGDRDIVEIIPEVDVFPDAFHRKQSDKSTVVSHVIREHFFDSIAIKDYHANLTVTPGVLVYGAYRYEKYRFTNRRRWVKEKNTKSLK